jgi:predicted AlkP superfamily pyrophosphatase or phosphodiesterase
MSPAIPLLAFLVSVATGQAAPRTALLVSIDGLHPDAVTAQHMPRLAALARRGQYTPAGRSTRPPKTLIAHTAMLTGMAPEQSGKLDNGWAEGQPRVRVRTLFDVAKDAGYRTAFFYGKEKLGYLSGEAVDVGALAPEDGIERTATFLATPGPGFVVLHVSGLESVGMEWGWLSPEYLARAREIDARLGPLLDVIVRRGSFLLAVTSDHAGHDLEHGTDHPEDGRRPLLLYSDRARFPEIQAKPQEITALAPIVSEVLAGRRRR